MKAEFPTTIPISMSVGANYASCKPEHSAAELNASPGSGYNN